MLENCPDFIGMTLPKQPKGDLIMRKYTNFFAVCLVGLLFGVTQLVAQEVLPFPEPPSASKAGKTLKDSKHQWRKATYRQMPPTLSFL
jgi:hypothetical protein